ncbi:MAG: AtpZ/AtpI family protein [Candidatus Binatia bacterium]
MPRENTLLAYGRYGALGFEFAGAVLAGIFVGRYADSALGTEPWLMILGAVGGMAGAIYRLIVVLERLSRRGQDHREDREA